MSFVAPLALGQRPFLENRGNKLFLAGREFRTVGFNKHDLLLQYYMGGESRITAKKIVRQLAEHDNRILKIAGTPYMPAEFELMFFDKDKNRENLKLESFFAAFDELVEDCERSGEDRNLLAITLMPKIENLADLGRHSLHEAVTNPYSEGRKKAEKIMLEIVKRYRFKTQIAVWVVGSEWNLLADLQMPEDVISGSAEGDFWHPGPVVRDGRNNFNSLELANLYRDLYFKIKTVDPNHLITTGTSEPRPAAMHFLRASISRKEIDWQIRDSLAEREEYIKITNGDADLISINHYGIEPEIGLNWYQNLAIKLAKSLFIAELGINSEDQRPDYNSPNGLRQLENNLNEIVATGVPLSCLWVYSEKRGPFQLFHGVTVPALLMVEAANYRHQKIWPARSRQP